MYAVVKIKFKATVKKAIGDQLNKDIIIRSSPKKFIVGGNAILNNAIVNHQDQAKGKIINVPRKIIIVRVFVRSYDVLAKQKRAEDVRPCVIIIIIAPE